jgi:hypothetical protein
LCRRLRCGVVVAADELLVEDTMICVSDHDGAGVAVCALKERDPSRIVECFASNSRVLIGQFDIPAARGVAINRDYQGNVCSHRDSILTCHASRIRADAGPRYVEDRTPVIGRQGQGDP